MRARFSEKKGSSVSMSSLGESFSTNAEIVDIYPIPSGPHRCDTISLGDHRPEGAREAVSSSSPSHSSLKSAVFRRISSDNLEASGVCIALVSFPRTLRLQARVSIHQI